MDKPIRKMAEIEADQAVIQTEWVEALDKRKAIQKHINLLGYKRDKLMDELLIAMRFELANKEAN